MAPRILRVVLCLLFALGSIVSCNKLKKKEPEPPKTAGVPEIVEDFFVRASPIAGLQTNPVRGKTGTFRIGKLPRTLTTIGEQLEPRFGKLGREYPRIAFDKRVLGDDATLEWVTPGHALFEAVRTDVQDRVARDLRSGAVFWDLHAQAPYMLDAYAASVKDGRGNTLHRRLFVVRSEEGDIQTEVNARQLDLAGMRVSQPGLPLATQRACVMSIRQPTLFLDVIPGERPTRMPVLKDAPQRERVESFLFEAALTPFLQEVSQERAKENETVRRHIEISLGELIHRQQLTLGDFLNRRVAGENVPGLEGNIAQCEAHLDELSARLESRRKELDMERHCTIGDVQCLGRAWVLPHPEQQAPGIAPMVRDDEIEKIAVRIATQCEQAQGWVVESVENENRGYDLLSRKPHATEPGAFVAAKFIEVKGRAGIGEVALSANEYRTAQRLVDDYWLYVVFNCAATPDLKLIQNPARLGWQPVVRVEQYHMTAAKILEATDG